MYSDKEIIEGCLKNKQAFQELLYKKYAPAMFGICMRYSSDRDMAHDLLQEGFIKVYHALHTLKGDYALKSWMYQIFVRNSINFIKRKNIFGNETENLDNVELPIEEIKDYEKEHWLNIVTKQDALQMIQELPEKYRLVMNMFAVDQMSQSDIANVLNIKESSCRSIVLRARLLLNEQLQLFIQQKNAG